MAQKELTKRLEITAPVSEITSDATNIVKLDAELVKTVTDGDTDPQFVIICIEEGKSRSGIIYDGAILASVAEQINAKKPVGYLGHLHTTPEGKENLLPPPQTVWLGATTVVENGKTKLFVKGYNLPGSQIRDWIKRKAVDSVSWVGDAVLTPVREGGYLARELSMESLDWARKLAQGMTNAGVVAIVAEMERKDGSQVTAEEIAQLQLSEVETHNPGLVKTIKEMQKKDDEEATTTAVATAVAEKDKELESKLAEVPEVDEILKLRTFFGIDDKKSVFDALVEMSEKFAGMSKKMLQSVLDKMLEEKVPNEKARKLVGRLVAVSEMSKNDLDYINDAERLETELGTKVDDLIEKDEDVKAMITEMASDRGGLRLHNNGNGGSNGTRTDDDGVIIPDNKDLKENDNLSIVEETI